MFNTMSEEELISELLSLDLSDGMIGFTHLDRRDVYLLLPIIKKYTQSKQIEARIDELTLLTTYKFTDGVDIIGRSECGWSYRITELRKQQEGLK